MWLHQEVPISYVCFVFQSLYLPRVFILLFLAKIKPFYRRMYRQMSLNLLCISQDVYI